MYCSGALRVDNPFQFEISWIPKTVQPMSVTNMQKTGRSQIKEFSNWVISYHQSHGMLLFTRAIRKKSCVCCFFVFEPVLCTLCTPMSLLQLLQSLELRRILWKSRIQIGIERGLALGWVGNWVRSCEQDKVTAQNNLALLVRLSLFILRKASLWVCDWGARQVKTIK